MINYDFKNKRNSEGILISYKSYELNYKFTNEIFDKLKNYNCISKIKKKIDSEIVDFYFKKKIFWQIKKITDQYVIHEYDNKKNRFCPEINFQNDIYDYSMPIKLIENIYNKNIYIKKNNLFQNLFKVFKKKIKYVLFKNNFNLDNTNFYKSSSVNVAIKYDEGIDKDFRNDIFWLEDSNIPLKNIYLYFESLPLYNDFLKNKKLSKKYIDKGFNIIKLWKIKAKLNIKNLHNFQFDLPLDENEKWLLFEIKNFLKEIDFYYFFFQTYNIKIHYDPSESNTNVIAKQIALNELNSISFGRLRSYPNNCLGYFYCYYINDIFFVWGKDSLSRLIGSNNLISRYLITGNVYGKPSLNRQNELQKIYNEFKHQNIKKIILIVDTNISEILEQGIYRNDYINFYKEVFKLLNNKSVGLIIKPKRPKEFINSEIAYKFTKNNRCFIVKEKQTKSSDYATISDFVIGIQPQISSAFFESLIVCKRGIFYDYANLINYEKNIYSLNNNLFVKDLAELINLVKKYINSNKNNDIGNWNNYLNLVDQYQDFYGPKRVAKCLNLIFECYSKNINKKNIINKINNIL